jgi:hypothetical protein
MASMRNVPLRWAASTIATACVRFTASGFSHSTGTPASRSTIVAW